MMITTTLGEMDDARLLKREETSENDDQRLDTVEYCVIDCVGRAHSTGIPQGDGCFCEQHVHRSVHLTVKRWPVEAGAAAASFT